MVSTLQQLQCNNDYIQISKYIINTLCKKYFNTIKQYDAEYKDYMLDGDSVIIHYTINDIKYKLLISIVELFNFDY